MRGLGTIVNVAAVIAGTGVGLLLGSRLPERIRDAAMSGMGLVVIAVGVQSFLVTRNAVFPIVSIVFGGIAGEALRIEGRLEGLGETIRRRVERSGEESRFVDGFVTASLTYCVGALVILGPLQDGISGEIQLLIVKAALDGLVSIVYASAFGWGVGFSALVIAVIQGAMTVVGIVLGDGFLTERMVGELEATGGIMIMGIGFRLLDLKRIPVGSYLPGLVLAPLLVGLFATT